jgi:fructokinase
MNSPASPRPVVVLGEALVDEFPDGSRVAGGAPFNQARWLALLGVPVAFVSRVGTGDAGAACVLHSARRCGLDDSLIQRDPARPTGRVVVTLTPEPQYEIEADAAWDHIDTAAARSVVRHLQPAVLVFGTLAQRSPASREAVQAALATLAAGSSLRFADLNLRPMPQLQERAEATLHAADWLKLNDGELEHLLHWFVPGAASRAAALAALCRRYGLQRVIVTCGERGWYTLDADGRRDGEGAAPPVPQLVDTVGAGDAFSAVLVAGYANGWPLARSLAAAAQLAAAVCGERGAVPESDDFIHLWCSRLGLAAAQRRTPAGLIG